MVALVADHGVLVGEHGWTGKGDYQLHPELIHVPMLIRHPDGPGAGTTSDHSANTLDRRKHKLYDIEADPGETEDIAAASLPPA